MFTKNCVELLNVPLNISESNSLLNIKSMATHTFDSGKKEVYSEFVGINCRGYQNNKNNCGANKSLNFFEKKKNTQYPS